MMRALLSISLALLLGSAQGLTSLETLPALLWGSKNFLSTQDQQSGIHALYQVSSADELAAELFGTKSPHSEWKFLDSSALEANHQKLVTVFYIGELRREDMARKEGGDPAIASLTEALSAATSSLFLSDLQSTHQQLLEKVTSQAASVLQIGDCGLETQKVTVEELRSALASTTGQASVVVCNQKAEHSFQSIQEELSQAGRPFLILYAGQSEQVATSARPTARSLASTTGTSNEEDLCSRKCRVQVALFEVIILLIFLLVSLFLGLFMLHILDTPTRFEQEKKETNRHHD